MSTRSSTVLGILLVAFWGVNACKATSYNFTDLGALGGSYSEPHAINDSGEVVGYYMTEGTQRAFKYSNGTMTDLGTLGGLASHAYSINNSGQVVGISWTGDSSGEHIFLRSNGTMSDLYTLGDGTVSGINDNGVVVGSINFSFPFTFHHAFIYSNGTMTDLTPNTMILNSRANAINASGEVVGVRDTTPGLPSTAFLYNNGTMSIVAGGAIYNDHGPIIGYVGSEAYGINDAGEVVGKVSVFGVAEEHAFLFSNGTTTDLGTLGGSNSAAYGINASGQIVGYSITSNGDWHAFLCSGSGPMQDLNDLIDSSSGWTLTFANAINNNGWIVGIANNPIGDAHAFLLTPVPEPSTMILLSIGVISLTAYGWRRRAE